MRVKKTRINPAGEYIEVAHSNLKCDRRPVAAESRPRPIESWRYSVIPRTSPPDHLRSAGGYLVPTVLPTRFADSIHKGVAQQGFFHNGNAGRRCSCAQRGTGMADNENDRRQNLLITQFYDQLHSSHRRHSLIDNEAFAGVEISVVEKLGAAAIGTYRKSFQLKREL